MENKIQFFYLFFISFKLSYKQRILLYIDVLKYFLFNYFSFINLMSTN